MKLNIHKCDLCERTFDYDKEKEILKFPSIKTADCLSNITIRLGNDNGCFEAPRYNRTFDLCPDCMKKVLDILKIGYLP